MPSHDPTDEYRDIVEVLRTGGTPMTPVTEALCIGKNIPALTRRRMNAVLRQIEQSLEEIGV